ncbi:hypothetical protein EZV62_004019 [Acer yangbiense]|uniref:Uncharacterized protein n=1 Tax=Acer yangbiense TaxID=1000413 RepID=A0A5C7IJJ0_9ROSI|nr:hypothetical protein EZV62_004019 [Acer yangbiense]
MMAINKRILLLLCFLCCCFFISPSYPVSDTLEQSQQLEDGQHLVSADETFKLGFFSPGTSKYRYLGIWYNIPGFGQQEGGVGCQQKHSNFRKIWSPYDR